MASTAGGLTRRRGGATGSSTEDGGERTASPAPRAGPAETSYTSSENGHKIGIDPRDLSESAERSKQPKLTLMEEVLLMGLKDKQVSTSLFSGRPHSWHSLQWQWIYRGR